MKNIIKIDIEGDGLVTHNGVPMQHYEVDCKPGSNTLCVEGKDFKVLDVRMFNLGRNELINFGEYIDNKWVLTYEYPVFTWLHKKLNHGWLIKKD